MSDHKDSFKSYQAMDKERHSEIFKNHKPTFFNSLDLCAVCPYTDKERAESHLCETCDVYKGKRT